MVVCWRSVLDMFIDWLVDIVTVFERVSEAGGLNGGDNGHDSRLMYIVEGHVRGGQFSTTTLFLRIIPHTTENLEINLFEPQNLSDGSLNPPPSVSPTWSCAKTSIPLLISRT